MGAGYLHQELTSKTIHCFYKVYNTLGYGFLEKVYENASRFELERNGLFVAAVSLHEEHEIQQINYLKATEIEIGLLFNFGKEPEIRRKIFTKKGL